MDPGHVAFDDGYTLCFSPSPIAIWNQSNVTRQPGKSGPNHFGRIDSFRKSHVLLYRFVAAMFPINGAYWDASHSERELRLHATPAAIPTRPRAVVSEAAEKPEDSKHHQHGPERSVNPKAHASEKQENNDYKQK